MKPTLFTYYIVCMAVLVACSTDDGTLSAINDVRYSDVPIEPTASVTLPHTTRADFSGPVEYETFSPGSKIFGVTAFLGHGIPASWESNSRINFSPVDCDNEGKYTFEELKYFPLDYKIYFYAFSPMVNCSFTEGNSLAHPKITYALTGREDILWAKNESGIIKTNNTADQQQPDFLFDHKLQRVVFYVKRTANVAANTVINAIRIHNLYNKATLDLITGKLTFDKTVAPVTLSATYDVTPTTDYQKYPYDIMFEPNVTNLSITVEVNGTAYNKDVTLGGTNAGKTGSKYELQINIDGTSITINTPSIGEWEDIDDVDGTI